jgi:type IV pilus assembly protein PilW
LEADFDMSSTLSSNGDRGKYAMGKPGKKRLANLQQGFTLVEIIVAIAIAGIVIGAIYSTYKSQQDSYVAQEQVVEMQQNLRAALYMIGRDIRMAGFNPAEIPDLAGFETSLDDGDGTETTDSTNMAFTTDEDENEAISSALNANGNTEQIAYRLDSNRLQKFMYDALNGWRWETVAENIDAVNFVYLDGNGTPIDPTTATNLPLIRSVQITLLARTAQIARDFSNNQTYQNQWPVASWAHWEFTAPGDNFRRRLLTTEIRCRNMGI